MKLRDRIAHAWNVFRDTGGQQFAPHGYISTLRQERHTPNAVNSRTIVSSIVNRIANDAASINWEHVRVDENEHFISNMSTGLNRCLTLSANIDQNARDFKLDVVLSLLDDGAVAIVPVDTNLNPAQTSGYDILTLRVGNILQWAPNEVLVHLYNEKTGSRQDIWCPKKDVAIIENPFYSVMNAPNATLTRLTQKLALLDVADNQVAGKNLDLILQLPYSVKTPQRKQEAESRITSLTEQLAKSDYGIGYIDATEHITQLNRSVESNLLPQVEYLTKLLYAQLGISEDIFNGTASEDAILSYQQRVLEPILTAITTEMTRKWITSTGYTQGQRVQYYMDRFKLADISKLSDFMDKASRNEIMSPNEFRSILGLKASTDPAANELKNRNMSAGDEGGADAGASSSESDGIDANVSVDDLGDA